MRAPHKLLAAAAACGVLSLGLGAATAGAASAGGDPTPAQVRAAIHSATHSHELWATFNSCNAEGGQEVGIRGQMPALSFPAHLLMVVKLEEYSPTALRYVPINGSWKLGGRIFSDGALVQEGISLRFTPGVTLIGHITFEWFRDGRRLGETTLATTTGHHDDAGNPRGYSVGTCSLL